MDETLVPAGTVPRALSPRDYLPEPVPSTVSLAGGGETTLRNYFAIRLLRVSGGEASADFSESAFFFDWDITIF
jgi:hypothetical protein